MACWGRVLTIGTWNGPLKVQRNPRHRPRTTRATRHFPKTVLLRRMLLTGWSLADITISKFARTSRRQSSTHDLCRHLPCPHGSQFVSLIRLIRFLSRPSTWSSNSKKSLQDLSWLRDTGHKSTIQAATSVKQVLPSTQTACPTFENTPPLHDHPTNRGITIIRLTHTDSDGIIGIH